MSREAMMKMEPGLSSMLRGAIFSPRECNLNPYRLVEALARGAVRMGALFREGAEVSGLIKQGSRITGVRLTGEELHGDVVVLATGAWSGAYSHWMGVEVPVRPVRGQIVALYALPSPLKAIVFSGHSYLLPKRDGTIWTGTTQEDVGFDSRVTAEAVEMILLGAMKLVPSLKSAGFQHAWAGLRPGSPKGQPILGPVDGLEGLVLATGHFRSGILLSAITGQLIASYIAEGAKEPLRPFSLAQANGGVSG